MSLGTTQELDRNRRAAGADGEAVRKTPLAQRHDALAWAAQSFDGAPVHMHRNLDRLRDLADAILEVRRETDEVRRRALDVIAASRWRFEDAKDFRAVLADIESWLREGGGTEP